MDPLGSDSGECSGLRSPSASAGEAALKGLGELPSSAKKAEDQSELNLYPLRGKVLFYQDPFEPAALSKTGKPYNDSLGLRCKTHS
jgi:hypothetical protein